MSKSKEPARVASTKVIHLKDNKKPFVAIELKAVFGFVPEIIAVEKIPGQNNRIVVRAIGLKEDELDPIASK